MAKKDPGVSLDEYKKKLAYEREHIQIEYEKTMEQREALQELYKKREEEYETVKRFMEFLADFHNPEMRYFIISAWILRNRVRHHERNYGAQTQWKNIIE
jgi:vacuolar-type H+-ATPase subunit I/STV1